MITQCIFSIVLEKIYYRSDTVDWLDESYVRGRLTRQMILQLIWVDLNYSLVQFVS